MCNALYINSYYEVGNFNPDNAWPNNKTDFKMSMMKVFRPPHQPEQREEEYNEY